MTEQEPDQSIINQIDDKEYGKQPDIVSNAEISPVIMGDLKISALENYEQNPEINDDTEEVKADDLILSDENASPLSLIISGKECFFIFSADTTSKYIMKVINFFSHISDTEVTINKIGQQKTEIEKIAKEHKVIILKDSSDLKEYLEQVRGKEE